MGLIWAVLSTLIDPYVLGLFLVVWPKIFKLFGPNNNICIKYLHDLGGMILLFTLM